MNTSQRGRPRKNPELKKKKKIRKEREMTASPAITQLPRVHPLEASEVSETALACLGNTSVTDFCKQ